LQQNSLRFHPADNPLLFCFSKHVPGAENSVLIVINLDVHQPQSGWVELDFTEVPLAPPLATSPRALQLHDLMTDGRHFSEGRRLFVRLDPAATPAHIFRLRRFLRTEHDFDYFE
jgi:starch synthase (maltosyl-transferring)